MEQMRKFLSAPGLYAMVKKCFSQIPDSCSRSTPIKQSDCLMSGLAIFSLKYPSLLQFDQTRDGKWIQHNLKSLFNIDKTPSDTRMRERLDEIDPVQLRKPFKQLFAELQRGKALEPFSYMDGHYLLSLDGTGYFSSHSVHCDMCCVKNHHNGSHTYYHQMLGAVLVNPDFKEVIPLPPEPIQNKDGNTKNDCEQNASKRSLEQIRREHPHLKLIVVEDALYATGPHVQLLHKLNMKFIIGAKQYAHWFDKPLDKKIETVEQTDSDGKKQIYRFIKDTPLNGVYKDIKVTLVDYQEILPNGKKHRFTWITDLLVNKTSVMKIAKGGRSRWRIENETFNTLKNQGYNFEHNYGHGKKHLSTNFAYLMMLAFLIDQVQQLCCKLFQSALIKAKSKTLFWQKIRGFFLHYFVNKWEDIYLSISYEHQRVVLIPDTS